ncbi:nitroreductase family protein [Granulicoccus sp. GXG6511]|uniref:nitroreductase family protein n=1 Tax=Granulicoccus sp. GXG6511 TaxID=3381351 RepID=UPI003D7D11F2
MAEDSARGPALPEVIRRRHMTRRFTGEQVAAELVDEIVGYALRAPSAGFTQAVSLLVLTGDRVRRFWAVTTLPKGVNPNQLVTEPPNAWLAGMMTAPVVVLVWTDRGAYERRYAEPDKGWGTDPEAQPWAAPYWWVDAGMAAQNVLLGATAHGLGACFFGVPPDRAEAVRRAFRVPSDQLSVGALALGWPADRVGVGGSARTRKRRDRAELIHKEVW